MRVLERRSRAYVEARLRAGQIDHAAADLLKSAGLAGGLPQKGIPQRGFLLRYGSRMQRIDLEDLNDGKSCVIYGQADLTRDLIALALERGIEIVFEADDVQVSGDLEQRPQVRYRSDGLEERVSCDFVLGCDGYHGATRRAFPMGKAPALEKHADFSWVGIFTETPPISRELTYVYNADGFALCSMRSPVRSRIYLQCAATDTVDDWNDDRFWTTLEKRLGPELFSGFRIGPTIERSIVPMRGFMCGTLRFGNLFLVGDAAHIVPPSAAKGLNMAIADAFDVTDGLNDWYHRRDSGLLESYSSRALSRAWNIQNFSWAMTRLLHRPANGDAFDDQLRLTEWDRLLSTPSELSGFARRYVGDFA